MSTYHASARINVKALLILALIVLLVGAGLAGGYKIRKRVIANRALAAGTKAFDHGDWPEACKQLKLYLSKYPENPDILDKYARANMAVRPRAGENIGAAIAASRRLARLRPDDAETCQRLAKLYLAVGEFNEAVHVCSQRLAAAPDDHPVRLLLARALIGQRKPPEAAQELKTLIQKAPQLPEPCVLLANLVQAEDKPAVRQAALDALATAEPTAAPSPGGPLNAPASAPSVSTTAPSLSDLARNLLDEGVRRNPSSPLLLAHRASLLRRLHQDMAAARKDLEAADALKPADPNVLLLLTGEWMEQPGDGFDRADAELVALKHLDPETLADQDLKVEDLQGPRYAAEAALCARKADKARGEALADQALAELKGDERLGFIPTAVSLYLANQNVAKVGKAVGDYRTAFENRGAPSDLMRDQLAVLEAVLASAEKKPYDAIDQLEPLVARKPDNRAAWSLLIQAYRDTGRSSAVLTALESCVARWPKDEEFTAQLAAACMAENRWSDAARYAAMVERTASATPAATLTRLRAEAYAWLTGAADPDTGHRLSAELADQSRAHPRMVEFRVLHARIATRQGRTDEAITILRAAIQQCERPLPAAVLLSESLFRTGQRDAAFEVCRTAVKENSDQASPHLALAALFAAAGQQEDALKTLEGAVAGLTGEERAIAARVLAQQLLSQGQRPRGIEMLKALAAERSTDREVRQWLLRTPEVLGDAEAAQQIVDQLREIETDRGFQWRLEQARLWIHTAGQGKPEDLRTKLAAQEQETARLLNTCITADPLWFEPVVTLGALYELLGKDAQAEEAYRRLLEAQPGQADVAEKLVSLLLRQRRFAPAADVLRQLPERARALPRLRRQALDVALGTGDPATALQHAEALVAADPKDAASRVALARLAYGVQKDTTRALQLLDEADAITPGALGALTARAQILHAEKKDDEAIAVLNAAVEREKSLPVYLLRAQFYVATKQYDRAEADYLHISQSTEWSATGHQLLGAFYEQRGDAQKAIAAWEAGLKESPQAVELQQQLIRILLTSPQPANRARARAMLDTLLKQRPDDVVLLSLRTGSLVTASQPADFTRSLTEMEAGLLRVVESQPANITAQVQLAAIARARWDFTTAGERVTRAIRANPGNPRLILARAELEAEQNNDKVAEELAQSVLQRDPRNAAARSFLVNLNLRGGKLDRALQLNSQGLELDPQNEGQQVSRARILAAQGERKQAIEQLDAFCRSEAGRESFSGRIMLADLHRMEGNAQAAQACLDQAEQIRPGSAVVLAARLRDFISNKQFDAVLSALADYRARNPDDAATLLTGAGLLAASGDDSALKTARTLLGQITTTFPNILEGHMNLAAVAYQSRDFETAVRAYRHALELAPFHRSALNDLAWLLGEELKRPEEAIVFADRGVQRYPGDPHLLDTRGVLLTHLKRLPEARQDLERAIQLATKLPPTQARAMLHVARVCVQQGDASAAKAYLEKALNIDKEHHVLTDAERNEISQTMSAQAALVNR